MMTKVKRIADAMAERRVARRNYRATRHLDAKTLQDIGMSRDEWRRITYRTT